MTHATNSFHSIAASGESPMNALKSIASAIPGAAQHERLVKQTQKWVAQTFYGTLLKQVRKSPFRSAIMDGGHGGEAFGSMYDQQMAEHMSRGVGMKLVNSIVRKIEAKQAYAKEAAKSAKKDGKVLAPSKDINGRDINSTDANGGNTNDKGINRRSHVPANLRA